MTIPVGPDVGPNRDPGPSPPERHRRLGPRAVLALAAGLAVVVFAGVLVVTTRTGVTAAPPRPPASAPAAPVLGPAHDVYNGDLGDPFVLSITARGRPNSFIAFGTGDWPSRVPTATSSDLTTWQEGPDALPQLPSWAAPDPRNSLSWAPAVLDTGHGYVLFVSLPDARSHQQCIGAATSSSPGGPYLAVDSGPLICQHALGGSIDPAVVRDRSGQWHILWKNDGNTANVASTIWEQQLTGRGLAVAGPVHPLLSASQAWQGGIIEEPAVIPATGGGWWLFYSGNVFDRPEYATGLAFCPTLAGPCREAGNGPFLASAALHQQNQFAPGGVETFHDGQGSLWAVFDTWNRPPRNGRFYCCRSLQLAKVLSS